MIQGRSTLKGTADNDSPQQYTTDSMKTVETVKQRNSNLTKKSTVTEKTHKQPYFLNSSNQKLRMLKKTCLHCDGLAFSCFEK